MITLAAQIAEVRRELAVRSRVYPRLVAEGKLPEARSAMQIARLEAVLETLQAQVPLGLDSEAFHTGDGA